MQRLLKGYRMRRAVLHGEPERQGLREDHGVDRAKRLRPERRADAEFALSMASWRASSEMAIVVSLARRAACCSAFSISALPTPVLVPLSPDGNQMNGLKAVFAAFER